MKTNSILLFTLLMIGCSTRDNLEVEKEVFNYTLDSIILKNFTDFDLCGTFNNEYTDSILLLNQTVLDTFVSGIEYANMINQYRYYGGLDISLLLNDATRFSISKNTEYDLVNNPKITNHFSLSAPLVSEDKKTAVLFFTGYNLREMVVEDYIYIYKKDIDNEWEIYFLEVPYPHVEINHPHSFSLIPR